MKRTDYNSLLGTLAREANGKPDYSDGKVQYHEYYINGHFVQCIFEYNQFHGDILRQWAIDGNDYTTVYSKYWNGVLMCDCSNGLIGAREFEKGSIKYEFFIKPLGLDPALFEYQEYTDKTGYQITPYKLNRVLYGENSPSSWLDRNHPATKLQYA